MNPLLSAAIAALLRHGLASAAMYFVQRGYWNGNEATSYVEGATLFLLSYGWSVYQKWDAHKALAFMRQLAFHVHPPPQSPPT